MGSADDIGVGFVTVLDVVILASSAVKMTDGKCHGITKLQARHASQRLQLKVRKLLAAAN